MSTCQVRGHDPAPLYLCCVSCADLHLLMSTFVGSDMDGFKLLEHIGLELDLPVISKFSPPDSSLCFVL